MIDKMSEYIVNNMLFKGEQLCDDEKDIMLFGVMRILEDIPKFITIFLMCYLLNILAELGIVFAITIIYKTFVGGAHARTNIQCFLVSSIYFILPIMIAKYVNYSLSILNILYLITIIFSVYVIMKIAPADTEEIPIINKNKRKVMKIAACISLMVISVITILLIKDITYIRIIIYTIFLINIFTTKLMYRLLQCKLGSESEEFGKFY